MKTERKMVSRRGNVAVGEVVVDGLGIGRAGDGRVLQQGLQLRGKDEDCGRVGVVERLLADPVAGQQQGPARTVPEGKGEHAPEMLDAVGPILFVGVEDDLGVAVGCEAVPLGLEAGAEFLEVVDFAVEGDPDGLVLVGHGLPAAVKVDDAQAPLAEPDLAVDVDALSVRSAVGDVGTHSFQEDRLDSGLLRINNACNAAHTAASPRSWRSREMDCR